MNVKGLIELISFIPIIPDEKFHYGTIREGSKIPLKCNSVGCLLGWSTIVGDIDDIDTNYRYYRKEGTGDIKFLNWSMDFFQLTEKQWQFLFSAMYLKYDPKKSNAINRINYLIDNDGTLPSDWLESIKNNTLFYLTEE